MDEVQVHSTSWRGVPAWLVASHQLEAVVTRVGGHLAAIRHPGSALNPLWQPPWPAADPASVRSGGFYGGIEASLLATIVGHNLSLDRFGPPRHGERRPVHGEVNTLSWQRSSASPGLCEFTVRLPEARLLVRKRLRFEGETLLLAHGVYHQGPGEREIEWCEHVSLGDPFLDGAAFSAGIATAYNWPGAAEAGSRFAAAAPGAPVDAQAALAMPAAGAPPCGDVVSAPAGAGWWQADNAALGYRLSYRWQPADFPWLTLWTQHRSRANPPWLGRTRARGMEITTKPWPDGEIPPSRHPRWHGQSTMCRVPAGRWTEHALRIAWNRLR
jgi:hypothetical protein